MRDRDGGGGGRGKRKSKCKLMHLDCYIIKRLNFILPIYADSVVAGLAVVVRILLQAMLLRCPVIPEIGFPTLIVA